MDQHLINALHEGMHSDNDPNDQPPNSYREAWNGTISPLGNNRFAFDSMKGNVVSFTVPDHYKTGSAPNRQKPFQPIGWYSFIDYLIVILANDDTGSPGEIAKVSLNNDGSLGSYIPLYYHTGLRLTKDHPIPHDAIVGKPENSNIKRIVWSDNYNSMRTMNWADSRFTAQIASGSLVNGTQYMVLTKDATSYITYNATDYAPGRASGNIFTANATTTFTTTGSNVWVIAYVPIESFSVVPDFSPGSIRLKGYVTNGSLPEGDYQYFYQLETLESARTNYSYLSLPMSLVGNLSNLPSSSSVSYGAHASNGATNSGKGLKLTIDNIDNVTYKKIRVGFVRKTAYGVYTDPEIFYYETIASSSVDIIHYGNEATIEALNLNDITTPTAVLDLVRSISSTKNILFAANVGLAPDPIIDFSAVRAKTIEYLMPSDILGLVNFGTPVGSSALYGHGMVQDANTGNGLAYPNQWYEVVSGSVTYNTLTYNTGDFFKGIPGTTAISGSGKAVAVIRLKKYTSGTTINAGNYNNIRIESDFCDHKGLMATHYLKSLWRSEKYRYGIFFYGKKGQQNFVQWLIDKTIPHQYNAYTTNEGINRDGSVTTPIGFNPRLCDYNSTTAISLRAIGISFSNLDFQKVADAYGCALADLDDFVKGFSIVRVERDSQIVSQGVLWPTMVNSVSTDETEIMSTNFIGEDFHYNAAAADGALGRRKNFYVFHSPDDMIALNSYSYEGRPSELAGDKMIIVDKYSPISGVQTGVMAILNHDYYDKFVNQTGAIAGSIYANGSEGSINPEKTVFVGFGGTGITVSGLPGVVNNRGKCRATYDNGSGGIGVRELRGAGGVFVWIDNTETGGNVFGFGRWDYGDTHRPVCNWVRPNSNLYGGDSDAIKASHRYLFCGHYQPLDSAFMSYMTGTAETYPTILGLTYYTQGTIIQEGTSLYRCIASYTTLAIPVAASLAPEWTLHQANGTTKTAGIVNNVEVFGGDAYVSLFGFGRGVREDASANPQFSSGCVIPLESNLNQNWRSTNPSSPTMNNKRFYNAAASPDGMNYPSPYESFHVYPALTGPELQYFFTARPQGLNGVSRDEHIIMYSLEKIDGEIVDNWRRWLINNYKRVDGQYGPITNIVAKSSRLFYIQNKGVGYLPVFERQLQDSSLGDAIQLGIGGILDRFDEIDYEVGNQHQMSLMVGQDAMVWFDWRKKYVMRLSFSGGKQALSLVKGLDAFFNNKFTEVEGEVGDTIFNSENPLTGKGIISYFDPRMKIGMMCFKYNITNAGDGFPYIIERDFTVLFSNTLDKFIGFSNISPNHIISHNGHLLMTRQARPSIVALRSYTVGEEVTDGVDYHNYTCILAFTTGLLPVVPSSDSTHWVKTSQINQIYVNWRGDICKFFGKVHESFISVIIKTPDGMKNTVDNIEVNGNDTRFTDVYVSNTNESGQDTDITSTNPNYSYVDGSWWFNIPFSSTGSRLSDSWMQVKMRVKNYVTNPTVSTNTIKRIFSVKSSIRKKN